MTYSAKRSLRSLEGYILDSISSAQKAHSQNEDSDLRDAVELLELQLKFFDRLDGHLEFDSGIDEVRDNHEKLAEAVDFDESKEIELNLKLLKISFRSFINDLIAHFTRHSSP